VFQRLFVVLLFLSLSASRKLLNGMLAKRFSDAIVEVDGGGSSRGTGFSGHLHFWPPFLWLYSLPEFCPRQTLPLRALFSAWRALPIVCD